METIQSAKARENWAKTFDNVFFKGPALIQKNDRVNLFMSGPHMNVWLRQQFPLEYTFAKEDGVHMVSLTGIPDIFGYGDTITEAGHDLAEHLKVLTEEMYEDFERFATQRPHDIPYLLQLSMMQTQQFEQLIAVTADG
ncbi:hypothetical protein [Cohnella herbarum]|nr:hypothetical protein [Cohnella herbarum]